MTDQHGEPVDAPLPSSEPTAEAPTAEAPIAGAATEADGETGTGPVEAPRQHPVVVYTLLRFGILVATGAVLYLLSVRGVWLILFAFLISGLISGFVLARSRQGAVLGLTRAYSGINERIDARARAEDHDDDLDEPPTSP